MLLFHLLVELPFCSNSETTLLACTAPTEDGPSFDIKCNAVLPLESHAVKSLVYST